MLVGEMEGVRVKCRRMELGLQRGSCGRLVLRLRGGFESEGGVVVVALLVVEGVFDFGCGRRECGR